MLRNNSFTLFQSRPFHNFRNYSCSSSIFKLIPTLMTTGAISGDLTNIVLPNYTTFLSSTSSHLDSSSGFGSPDVAIESRSLLGYSSWTDCTLEIS